MHNHDVVHHSLGKMRLRGGETDDNGICSEGRERKERIRESERGREREGRDIGERDERDERERRER